MIKALIFNPFGIGDVLFTTPLIRNLKENLGDAAISYICNRRTVSLLTSNIFLDNVSVFEKDEWRALGKESKWKFCKTFFSFLGEIRREKYDVVFDLSLNPQYGFFFKMAGIKKRIGYNFKNRGRFLTHKLDLCGGYQDKHMARYYLDLLKFLNITGRDCPFDLFLSDETLRRGEEILESYCLCKDDLLIAVCPGAGDSWRNTAYFKRWPQEYFLRLSERLIKEKGAVILLFGSAAESELCEDIYKGIESNAVNLCGKINLQEFCAVLSFCKAVVANDGGPFHMAQALGRKGIVFYGPVDDKVYGVYPDNSNFAVFTADVSCRPCYAAFKFRGCEFDKRCLKDISVDHAFFEISSKIIK